MVLADNMSCYNSEFKIGLPKLYHLLVNGPCVRYAIWSAIWEAFQFLCARSNLEGNLESNIVFLVCLAIWTACLVIWKEIREAIWKY